jgi:hypothetical protein
MSDKRPPANKPAIIAPYPLWLQKKLPKNEGFLSQEPSQGLQMGNPAALSEMEMI